ncbi:MAG: tol-pal system protein YbgF [Desulfobacteraceae bacterium]|nr:tol-pal system protein YbgF [Desulfobacteraceae bacterium]
MQQGSLKAVTAAASLLFAGVMLASCAMVTPKPAPEPAVQPEVAAPGETEQINAQLNEIKTLLGTIQNTLSSQERSIGVLEQRIDALERPKPQVKTTPKPTASSTKLRRETDPTRLYKTARGLLLEENFQEAAQLFKTYVTRHPDAELADNALYWLGECSYSMGKYPNAIETFKELVDRYPKRAKVPDALLKTAYAYLSLEDSDRAHHYLKLVVKRYPFTPAGEKAEQKLKAFQ